MHCMGDCACTTRAHEGVKHRECRLINQSGLACVRCLSQGSRGMHPVYCDVVTPVLLCGAALGLRFCGMQVHGKTVWHA